MRNVSDESRRQYKTTHFMFKKSCRFWDNAGGGGIGRPRQATDAALNRRELHALLLRQKYTHIILA
jgi:hypothetical protein